MYTAISKKVVIVNSRYWNRRKLWGSNFSSNLLLLVLTLHNIECRLIMMPRPYSNKLFWCIISRYDSYQQFLSVPVLTIDYDNLFWNIYIWNKKNVNDTESSCWHMGIVCRNGMLAGTFRTQKFFYPTSSFRCSPRGFSATCLQQIQGSVVEGLSQTATSGSQCFFVWVIKLCPQLTVHNTGISLLLSTSVWVLLSPPIERRETRQTA